MKIEKLFKVMVVGGSMMATGSMLAQEGNLGIDTLDGVAPVQTFCNPDNEKICVENDEGDLVVRDGFTCCWGTSCEE